VEVFQLCEQLKMRGQKSESPIPVSKNENATVQKLFNKVHLGRPNFQTICKALKEISRSVINYPLIHYKNTV